MAMSRECLRLFMLICVLSLTVYSDNGKMTLQGFRQILRVR